MKLKFYQISLVLIILVFVSCNNQTKQTYTHHASNFWYKLLAFSTDTCSSMTSMIPYVHLNAVFKTQNDSVFYDTYNNLNSQFFLNVNSLDSNNLILKACEGKCIGDSMELLIPVSIFFNQNFNSNQIPFFSFNDSIVKVQMGINDYLHAPPNITKVDLEILEKKRILNYFGDSTSMNSCKLEEGIFWISKPSKLWKSEMTDSTIVLHYKGYFLNGRPMDESPVDFKYKPGTPDQLLKGLNIVINYLKRGENAKIILPSHLAFGESGSRDLKIPPFTPLLYEITIK
jgi:hypothetical protein